MRCVVVLSLLAAAACASSNGNPTGTPGAQTVRVIGSPGGSAMSMTSNGAASTSDVPFSLDAVWRILPAVYDSLAVPITVLDPAKHLIGNESYKLRRQLGKVSLSRYIDCGDTQIGPSADSYDIVLTVLTQITAGPSGNTHIATSVEAQGKPITHSQEYSRCTSKGLLETRVAEIVNARLQK